MKFRKHRGLLSESMETQIEVESISTLKAIIESDYNLFDEKVESINFKYVGFDNRINQESYYVIVKLSNMNEPFVYGISDSVLTQ